MKTRKGRWGLAVAIAILVAIGLVSWWGGASDPSERSANANPTRLENGSVDQREMTMVELLDLALDAQENMIATVDDYTARFVKQERTMAGKLGETTEMEIKVQTTHRGGQLGQPMRVYLNFLSPDEVAGRAVIWGEDLFDGKLIVREAGILGRIRIPPLDPEGMIAMRGQRYPISEIGLTKLIEKLIERGELDRDDESIRVTLYEDHQLDDLPVWLIRVERPNPVEGENNFSLAEILFEPKRKLVLSYRSFGWPEGDEVDLPLLESYTYHDVQINVGLSDADFDPRNEAYDFP